MHARSSTPLSQRRPRGARLWDAAGPAPVPEPVRVATATVGFRRVVTVAGELDMATVATLREAVEGVLLSSERDIWIDLTHVGFIDSSGLHVLFHAHRMLERDQRRLAIIAPAGPVLRTLRLVGADRLMALFPDRASAHRLS